MEPSSTRNGIHTILKTQTSVDKLMSYLELRDICRMARTSRDIAISVNRYRRRTWDINKFLRRWFNSPTSFRKTLRICDAILHDTAVRGFFDRDTQQSRLDILLSLEGLYVMGVWLERSGYTMLPHRLSTLGSIYRLTSSLSTLCINLASYARIVHTVEARHIVSVVFSNRKFPTTTVVVSVARKDPIADILNSHSTANVNFITWNRMTSVFPSLTFCDHMVLAMSDPTSHTVKPAWVLNLEESGFLICGKTMASLTQCSPRTTVDRFCWLKTFEDNSFIDTLTSPVNSRTLKHFAFDVVHWNTGITKEGASLAIGDEFDLSSTAYVLGSCRDWDFGVNPP